MTSPEWFVSAIENSPEHHYVDVEGANIHYSLWGDSSKPWTKSKPGFDESPQSE